MTDITSYKIGYNLFLYVLCLLGTWSIDAQVKLLFLKETCEIGLEKKITHEINIPHHINFDRVDIDSPFQMRFIYCGSHGIH